MKEFTLSGRRRGTSSRCLGAVSFGCLLFLLIMIALGYVGLKVGEAYWKYFEAREKIREAMNWAATGDPKPEEEIIKRVITKTREVELELSVDDIRVQKRANTLTVIVNWVQEVEFPYYTLPLRMKVTVVKERR